MELNDYYLHAIYNNADMSFDEERTLRVLKEILDSGAIKSRRLRGISDTSCGGWNGLDYISICDYCRRNARPYGNNKFLIGYTAYETYIKKSLSFILKKGNITTIKPTLVAPVIFDWDSKFRMCELGNSLSGRFSDLPDELQVKDMISIDRVKGMTVPIDYMISEHMPFYKTSDCKEVPPYSAEDVIQFLERVKLLLRSYDAPSELYELETQSALNSSEDVIKAVATAKNKQLSKKLD